MNNKTVQLIFVLAFLLLIFSVSIVQSIIDLAQSGQPFVLQLFQQFPTQSNLRMFEKSLESESWFAKHAQPVIRYWQFVLLHDAGDKAVTGKDGWLFFKPGIHYITERADKVDTTQSTWQDSLTAIIDFKHKLQARGIQLIALPVPGKASVYPNKLTSRISQQALMTETKLLIQSLKENNIEVIDLHTLFQSKMNENNTAALNLYLMQDTHWTPEGMSLAAKHVAEKVVQLQWTQKGSHRFEARPNQIQRHGDILTMLELPALKKIYEPEIINCLQIYDVEKQQYYRDDPESDVLILGDSFLRIYETDEPLAAGFASHLAYALQKPVTSIVNDGGASTLVRQELNRKPHLLKNKRVVIWEFVERDIRYGAEGWQKINLPN